MKKVLLIYVVLIAGIIIWYYGIGKERRTGDDSRTKALSVSKHSLAFNQSMEALMGKYYSMTGSFAKGDTAQINKDATALKLVLDSLKLDELRKDSSIYETAASFWENTRTEIGGMISDSSLQAKRESLNLFSNELFTLLLAVRYDLSKLYWQECGSAFGEDTPGSWITKDEQTKNPYGQDNCASVKKVINFLPSDSAGK